MPPSSDILLYTFVSSAYDKFTHLYCIILGMPEASVCFYLNGRHWSAKTFEQVWEQNQEKKHHLKT